MKTIPLYALMLLLISSCTSISYSIKWNNIDKIKLALEKKNTDPNARTSSGDTFLMLAVKENNIEAAKLLIQHGADVNATKDPGSVTALRIAIQENLMPFIKYLLDNGADINQKNIYGWTPLMSGAKYASQEVINLLIERGADIFSETKIGRTARKIADEENRISIMILLKRYEDRAKEKEKAKESSSIIENKEE
ncbi:hypothetical protein LSH36_1091g00219 [Paralvinella palmiformis]|uniref:Ankyrin repeat domain-containing protein n=1 Tax=Paralvinella palmiformis TaxID=53620 RepID=A0AAD9IWR9_9ANNE|nr:hypothetical protein LSH36_1091g00219 [Paralvinella palmiformis]